MEKRYLKCKWKRSFKEHRCEYNSQFGKWSGKVKKWKKYESGFAKQIANKSQVKFSWKEQVAGWESGVESETFAGDL